MSYPEKKASRRKYLVRPDPVTHAMCRIAWTIGRRVAMCCVGKPGRPRHDDGFTFDQAQVDCTRCKELLP